jgi:hypothetical protein
MSPAAEGNLEDGSVAEVAVPVNEDRSSNECHSASNVGLSRYSSRFAISTKLYGDFETVSGAGNGGVAQKTMHIAAGVKAAKAQQLLDTYPRRINL